MHARWLLLLAVAGCGRGSSNPSVAPEPEARPVFDASPPPPPPYHPSTDVRATLDTPASLPTGAAWPDRVLTAAELDAALRPIADADLRTRDEVGARVVAGLGTVAFAARRDSYAAGLGTYDFATGSARFEGAGFRGLESAVILSFEDDPPITIGSLPGPFGGNVSLGGAGHIAVRLFMEAATASHLAATRLEEQYLVRAVALRQFDDVPYVRAELLGYRLVDPRDHTVYYDSLGSP
jgi:hypothetical protein